MMTKIDYLRQGTTAGVMLVGIGLVGNPVIPSGYWQGIQVNSHYSDRIVVDALSPLFADQAEGSLSGYNSAEALKLNLADGGTKKLYPLEDYNKLIEG